MKRKSCREEQRKQNDRAGRREECPVDIATEWKQCRKTFDSVAENKNKIGNC